MWLYGSGFPKSMDISKQIDKRGGNNTSFLCNLIKEKREEKNLSQKQLDELMETSGMVNWWEKGERGITPIQFNKLCKILELPFKNIEEAEREVIGTKKSGGASAWANGMNNKENKEQKYTGFSEWEITAPATDLAKQWKGWGTALKPSFEPIIVARKPFKGSLVDNVIEYDVGGINIDECRVGNEERTYKGAGGSDITVAKGSIGTGSGKDLEFTVNGRFPANTILTYDETDFDEVCGGFPKDKGYKPHKVYSNIKKYEGYGSITQKNGEIVGYGDSGSASRYFYCAKASKKDRDEGLDEFEDKYMAFSNQAKAELKRGNVEFKGNEDNPMNFVNSVSIRKNTHPTVKPTELMQYLVRLVTPKGGTILDPFMGSGSTGKAVMFENKERDANYKFIGIEREKEYYEIANARIKWAEEYKEETLDSMQININEILGE